jgi:protein TonB
MPAKPILIALFLLSATISKAQDTAKPAAKIALEAAYPGGDSAWKQYLMHHLHYPMSAIENKAQGDVVVQFQIDAQGNTSDYKVISGPKSGLREEALRVIKESGKWEPSSVDGNKVASLRRETIHFRITVQ